MKWYRFELYNYHTEECITAWSQKSNVKDFGHWTVVGRTDVINLGVSKTPDGNIINERNELVRN